MNIDNLTPEQQEKAKAARTPEELEALAEEGGQELSDEQLGAVSGGSSLPRCSSYVTCPKAHDLSGRSCRAYRFL